MKIIKIQKNMGQETKCKEILGKKQIQDIQGKKQNIGKYRTRKKIQGNIGQETKYREK